MWKRESLLYFHFSHFCHILFRPFSHSCISRRRENISRVDFSSRRRQFFLSFLHFLGVDFDFGRGLSWLCDKWFYLFHFRSFHSRSFFLCFTFFVRRGSHASFQLHLFLFLFLFCRCVSCSFIVHICVRCFVLRSPRFFYFYFILSYVLCGVLSRSTQRQCPFYWLNLHFCFFHILRSCATRTLIRFHFLSHLHELNWYFLRRTIFSFVLLLASFLLYDEVMEFSINWFLFP